MTGLCKTQKHKLKLKAKPNHFRKIKTQQKNNNDAKKTQQTFEIKGKTKPLPKNQNTTKNNNNDAKKAQTNLNGRLIKFQL